MLEADGGFGQAVAMRWTGSMFWIAWAAGGILGAGEPVVPQPVTGGATVVFQTVCAGCHGERGEGKRELLAPSIAGMPRWYTALQLEKFREGVRGKPHLDLGGTQMRAIALAVTPALVPDLAAHIEGLKPFPTEGPAGADAVRGGEMFNEICSKCHRYNGQGEIVFRSAPLTTLPGWYLVESLRKFRDGLRGYEHGDLDGPKMREIASILGDREIDDLVAYIATLSKRYPPGEPARAARERRISPVPPPE